MLLLARGHRIIPAAQSIKAQRCKYSSSTSTDDSPLPPSADTVIIGGGVAGCSIAYHLSKQGSKDRSVLLLEKSELTAGSTWHAAGLTTLYHPYISLKKLHYYSINFFTHLERETGMQLGIHRPGSLRLATSPERIDEFNYQLSRQGWNDAPYAFWTPEQIAERIPIIDVEGGGILGGLFTPLDGHIDPYSLTMAIAAGARKHGAKIAQRTGVTSIKMREEDHTWEVETTRGMVRANRVVNASGFWAREVAAMYGQDLPLVPVHHQYLVTKTVPEVKALNKEIPVLRHLDGSFYLRQERDGLLVGPYESEKTMKLCEDWSRDRVPPGFGKELFQPDLDRLQPHLELAMKIVPCFEKAEIKTVVNGPIMYTPDVVEMLGPSLLPNMWLAVGLTYGIIHSGGAGKYLADWILNGEPPYDLVECDPERFGKWANMDFAVAKIRESYGMNNAVPYLQEDRPAGRPTSRTTPIHDDLVAAGAFMGFHYGWEGPDWFTSNNNTPEYKPSFYKTNWHASVLAEHHTVTTNVGIKDLTPFAKFYVEGKDSEAFLDYLLAGTVPAKKFRTSVAHALTKEAKVYSELTVTRLDENGHRFMVVTGGGVEGHDLRHLEQVARDGQYDVEVRNVTEELCALGVAGPKSGDLITAATGIDHNEWKFLDSKECKINNVSVLAIRISYTGELGWELYVHKPGMRDVYRDLINKGKKFEIGHFGNHAANVLRLEKGFKLWGAEMNMDADALQAGLDSFIRFNKKANFLGKERLLQKRTEFRNKHLVMLAIEDSSADPQGNESIWLNGKVVGYTTSGCFSPVLNKGLAFAYVPTYASFAGCSELDVDIMGEKRRATVLEGPPVLTHPARERKKMGKN